MDIAIVEDNKEESDYLTELLKKYKQEHTQDFKIFTHKSGEDFLQEAVYHKFDLVFMDIYLEMMDGIETAVQMQSLCENCLTVFLTFSSEDIWRAVGMHGCFDYIKKDDLNYRRLEMLLEDVMKRLKIQERTLNFSCGKQNIRLRISHIRYLIARDKYTVFNLQNGIETPYRTTFSTICSLLESEPNFLLCNRGVMLNMDFIDRAEADIFVMTDGHRFPIRRIDRSVIIKRYHDYQFEKLYEQEGPG